MNNKSKKLIKINQINNQLAEKHKKNLLKKKNKNK